MLFTELPLLPCFHKQLLGFSCPICGLQRSLLLLIQGEVWDAVVQFPPLPLLLTTPVILIYLFLRHRPPKSYRWLGIVWLAMLAFNWIYQNLV